MGIDKIPMGIRGKARPGRDADHSPPSSAEVKYEQELYLLSPHVPPWHVAGKLSFFLFLQRFGWAYRLEHLDKILLNWFL
jgi:hypothetical protein